jgi:hypothetical protein
MKMSGQGLELDQPGRYEIRVQGRIGAWGAEWFDTAMVRRQDQVAGRPITALSGVVADQAALLGLLLKLYQLGLPLLEVRWMGLDDAVAPIDAQEPTLSD